MIRIESLTGPGGVVLLESAHQMPEMFLKDPGLVHFRGRIRQIVEHGTQGGDPFRCDRVGASRGFLASTAARIRKGRGTPRSIRMEAIADPAELSRRRNALLEYCRQDTLGLVRLLGKMRAMEAGDTKG
jgi:hypothetical protein